MEFAVITLVTKRGEVIVRFQNDGTLFDIRAGLPCNWDDKTWRHERSRLIYRARRMCEKVWLRRKDPYTLAWFSGQRGWT